MRGTTSVSVAALLVAMLLTACSNGPTDQESLGQLGAPATSAVGTTATEHNEALPSSTPKSAQAAPSDLPVTRADASLLRASAVAPPGLEEVLNFEAGGAGLACLDEVEPLEQMLSFPTAAPVSSIEIGWGTVLCIAQDQTDAPAFWRIQVSDPSGSVIAEAGSEVGAASATAQFPRDPSVAASGLSSAGYVTIDDYGNSVWFSPLPGALLGDYRVDVQRDERNFQRVVPLVKAVRERVLLQPNGEMQVPYPLPGVLEMLLVGFGAREVVPVSVYFQSKGQPSAVPYDLFAQVDVTTSESGQALLEIPTDDAEIGCWKLLAKPSAATSGAPNLLDPFGHVSVDNPYMAYFCTE